MKTTSPFILLAALALSSCDKKQEAATEAKVKEVSAETKVKAEGAIEKMKAAGAEAAEKTKEVSSSVVARTRVLASQAVKKTRELSDATTDFAKEKLGIPETDGLLDGLEGMFTEAGEALKNGKLKEKAGELRAKWNSLYAKAEQNMATLAPEKKAKFKAFLEKIHEKWEALISSEEPSK